MKTDLIITLKIKGYENLQSNLHRKLYKIQEF